MAVWKEPRSRGQEGVSLFSAQETGAGRTAGTGLVSVAPLLAGPDGFLCSSTQMFSWGVLDFTLGGAPISRGTSCPCPTPFRVCFPKAENPSFHAKQASSSGYKRDLEMLAKPGRK